MTFRQSCLVLPAALVLALLGPFHTVAPAAVSLVAPIGGVQPSAASEGTQLTITGAGFGVKKPKVQLVSVPGARIWTLKVLSFSDTLIVARVAKATVGTWDVVVQPKTKGAAPILFPSAVQVKAPIPQLLTPDVASPGSPVSVSGQFFGTRKGTVKLGGKAAKVLTWTDEAIGVRVPPKLPAGTYEVLVHNRIGTASLPCAIVVPGAGGSANGCSDRVTVALGSTPFDSTGFLSVFTVGLAGPQPLLAIVAVRPGTPRLQIQFTIPFDLSQPQPGAVSGSPDGFVRVEQGGGLFDPDTTVWTTQGHGDDYSIAVTSVAGGQLLGTLQATLVRVEGTAGDSTLVIPSGSYRVRVGP